MSEVNIMERNDIDISKLFQWKREFSIVGKDGNDVVKVYIRLVGDAELNRSRVFALRKSAELRKNLKLEGTDENIAFIPEKNQMTRESLIELLVLGSIEDFTAQAIKEVKVKEPRDLPSDASLEDQEKYQVEIDEFPAKREKALKDYVDKQIEKRRKQLEKLDTDSLYDEYVSSLINRYCRTEMVIKFREMCAYFGTYIDSDLKERAFKSFDEFENLPNGIKSQIIDGYYSLEIGSDELKN